MSADTVRINKYFADKGLCSRREAETLIEKGWILINGEVITSLGYKVLPTDKVTVKEEAQNFLGKKKTIIINKPIGYVSAQAEGDYKHAIRLVNKENFHGGPRAPQIKYDGFAPAGRLDIDSTGLLILTQDGKLAKKIIAPQSDIEKEYVVKVEGKISREKIE
ncbi:MAG: rRNA pseudouridine synthase, partial [Bdellovibrionales bacterium]|nr:rRNA pseudouridine synthase [Bdellovibrionales bacterium]